MNRRTILSLLLAFSAAVGIGGTANNATNATTPTSAVAKIKPEFTSFFHGPPVEIGARRQLQFEFDPACSTPVSEWVSRETSKLSYSTLSDFIDLQIGLIPFLAKALFDDNEEDEILGANGEYTRELFARHSQMERFWKLKNPDISTTESLLLGAHGSMLQDTDKLVQMSEHVYEVNPGFTHRDVARQIQRVVEEMPGTYSNPLLTLNAVALSSEAAFREFGIRVVDAIVMGDGIIQAIEAQGFGLDGPDFILAHEYGHILQYELGSIPPRSGHTPSENRRQEMLCDAMAAYFMAHPLGGAHSIEDVDELHVTASLLGDYQFTAEDHHGTPAQRECSVLWAAGTGFRGDEIIPLTEFIDDFDQRYGMLLDTDETLCPTVVDKAECHSGATSWRIAASVVASLVALCIM